MDAISCIAWSPDGSLLALGAKTQPLVAVLRFQTADVFSVDASPQACLFPQVQQLSSSGVQATLKHSAGSKRWHATPY